MPIRRVLIIDRARTSHDRDGGHDVRMRMHDDQLRVDGRLAGQLVTDQFPEYAGLPVTAVTGPATVNAVFRVGDHVSARFPLRADDPARTERRLRAEAAAAAEFARVSPVPAPLPLGLGRPGDGYPLPWALQTWLPGQDATVSDPAHSIPFAVDLAALLQQLREVDPRGRRFHGGGRGGDLRRHDAWMATCLRLSTDLLDTVQLAEIWTSLRALPAVDEDVMCHGDLTPFNVVVHQGRLTGVIDAGGFGPADPALDLVCAWHLLDTEPRAALREQLACSDVQWARGMAWAFEQSMGLVHYYLHSCPELSQLGRRTLGRILRAYYPDPTTRRPPTC